MWNPAKHSCLARRDPLMTIDRDGVASPLAKIVTDHRKPRVADCVHQRKHISR
jgi:hypothetical protein